MAFAAGQNSRLLDMQRRFQQKHLTESKKNILQTPSIGVKENVQIKVPVKNVPVTHENLKADFSVKGKVTAVKTTTKILTPTLKVVENKPVLGVQNGKKNCDINTKPVGEKKIVNKKSSPPKPMVRPTVEQTKLPSLNNNKRNIKITTVKPEVKSPPKPPPRAHKDKPKVTSPGKPPANRPIAPGMARCPHCSRDFNSERIEKHKTVCLQTQKKKRKVFDMTKQRLEGTDAKEFVNIAKSKPETPVRKKKSNWRQKHEEFVANIRNARMAQQHLAKGGNLADLPPPPPLDTSDLTPCPHCGRKFNENAAARHIPLCLERQKKKPAIKQSVKRF